MNDEHELGPEQESSNSTIPENIYTSEDGVSECKRSKSSHKNLTKEVLYEDILNLREQLFNENLQAFNSKICALKMGEMRDVEQLQKLEVSHKEKMESIRFEKQCALASAKLELEAKNLEARKEYESSLERVKNQIRKDIKMQMQMIQEDKFDSVFNHKSNPTKWKAERASLLYKTAKSNNLKFNELAALYPLFSSETSQEDIEIDWMFAKRVLGTTKRKSNS